MTRTRALLLVAAIVLVSLNLRPAVVAVSPLLDEIRERTGMSSAVASLLTTLPVLCFGLLAPLAPRLARRFGGTAVVGGAMVVLAAGILLRLVPGTPLLFAGTILVGGGIAVTNVLMPSIIKRDFGRRSGPVMGAYAAALSAGAAIAAGAAIPLQRVSGTDWRGALALWAVLALAAVVVWATAVQREPRRRAAERPVHRPLGLWRDRIAWQVTLFMGFQSLQFYMAVAWLPTILISHGMASGTAGWMFCLFGTAGAVASLVAPVIATRAARQTWLATVVVALFACGWVGMLIEPIGGVLVWMTLLGLAQGSGIGLALTLIVLRAPDAEHAAELSGMAQTFGYLVAAAGPLAIGLLHDVTGGWEAPLVAMLVLLVPLLLLGLLSGRPLLVGDGRPPATGGRAAGVVEGEAEAADPRSLVGARAARRDD